ncbi:MAG TPA: PEP-CTERM sorting domain-containing protein [Syntrophorhabdales bacterium]|nr:PEP-CTERM sorting domain-containing protein [Syntrophorhabdales bacterium]
MKKLVGFIVLAFWVVGGLLLTPGVSFAQVPPSVPEPVSLIFLGAGLVGLGVIGRRIKK